MMGIKKKADRNQIELLSIDDLVPKNHLVRKLDAAINLDFIYDEVKDLYKPYGLVLCQEKVQIKFGQIVFVINMHFLHFLNSTYFHIHLEINIHNGCVFLLYYRMFLYIQKQVYMHVCNLKFYNDLTTLF